MYQRPYLNDMETMKVKAQDLFALTEELFLMGNDVQIRVTGNSMLPFLHHERDCVQLTKVPYEEIRVADIVLAIRKDGAYILHRVFTKDTDSFYMVGDAQDYLDGPYPKEKLVAKVTVLFRKGKHIDCRHIGYRFLVRVWMMMRPWRRIVFAVYRKTKGIFSASKRQ